MGSCCSSRPSGLTSLDIGLDSSIEQLCPNPSVPKQSVKVALRDNEEVLRIFTRVFAGCDEDGGREAEATFDWVLGPHLKDRWSDPRRHVFVEWMFKFGFALAYAHGMFILGIRSGSKLTAVAHINVYNYGWNGSCRENCIMMKALRIAGMPPGNKKLKKALTQKRAASLAQVASADSADAAAEIDEVKDIAKGMHKRLEKLATMEKYERKVCPGPHMHLLAIAVEPCEQGRGLGGKLLKQVNKIADHMGLPLYLETHGAKLPAIYARYGYDVAAKNEFNDSTDVIGSLEQITMLRKPGSFHSVG